MLFRASRRLVFALGAIAAPGRSWALSLVISPSVQVVEASPGETVAYPVQIRGPEDGTTPVIVYAWDYWHSPTEGRYIAPPGTTPRSAAGWIEPVPREVRVGESGVADVLVSVSVPPDAVGGYYAMVFAQTEFGMEGQGAQALAAARVGSGVVVHVRGTLVHDLDFLGASFVPPTETTPAKVQVRVQNQGNTDEQPEFRGMVRTTDGQVLGSLAATSSSRVLPSETSSFDMDWTGRMEPGAYELVGTVLYGDDQAIPVVVPLLVDNASTPAPARGK